ncbi:TonB-dependent receptor [Balneolaceae bacterium YR4-1]|uniref:TonB-dependent receptor n=1 Tax=Halalkalibaculum roseum TaxID=2709311 RepID=A0A6M1SY20_9BACT|nr:TonB-dependent receptor [Halalkalibaculum roseum]NGP76044.1 TonB-dependent receptor [Halalkalibaculum roseum]
MNKSLSLLTIFVLLVFISIIYNPLEAIANEGIYNFQQGAVQGTVTNEAGQEMPGVNIAFPQLNRGTVSKADGSYRVGNIRKGTYVLTFSFIGYQSVNREVTIKADETTTLNVTLEPRLIQSETITVTGTPYASDPLTTPADVDVLSGDAKFSKQQTSLGSSLDDLAGVSSISTGSQMGKPVIRGLSGSQVRVLDDGVAMDYQQYGVRHGPNVDPFTSERIEVVRGAASVQYGSDALGGAVNVISNSIPDALDREAFITGQLLSDYSTNNRELAGGIHLEGANAGWGYTGTLIRRSAGNMTAPDIPTFTETNNTEAPKFSGELDHTDYDQLNGSIGVGYTGSFGQVSAEYSRWSNEHNFLLPDGMGLGQNLENDVIQLKGNINLGNNFILNPKFTFSENLRQSNPGDANAGPRSELPEEGFAHLDILLQSYSAKTELEHPSVGPFRGTLGIEYTYQDQETRGVEPLVPSATVTNFATFLFEKAELGKLTISTGFRFDARTHEAEPNEALNLPDISSGETSNVLDQEYYEFSGSLGATYQFNEQMAIAANIGRGFRAPSLFNLHVDGIHGGVAAYQVGNPFLDSERSLNTDLSLRWRSETVTAKITAYRNVIRNYIFLVNSGEFSDGGQGPPILESVQGDARLFGANANFEAQLNNWLQVNGTFETVTGENIEDDIQRVDKLPLLPPTKFSAGIKLVQNKIGFFESPFLSIQVNHTLSKDAAGRYEPFWQFGNAPQFSDFGVASTDSYTLLNATLGVELPIWSRPVSVQISARNLFNEAYRNFLDTYKGYALSPGRNISFRVKVPFTIL